MHHLTKAVLKRPVTVIVTLIGLVLFSIISIMNMSLKLMPDISMPYMVVMSTYVGASPEEVDDQLIEPMRSATSSISGLKESTSSSSENYGYVLLQFEYGTDMDDAYSDVKTALDGIASSLPDDASDPTIMEIDMSAMSDMMISVSSDSPEMDVLKTVEDDIEPQLRRASALANIEVSGGDDRYISVELIPEYANQYGLSTSTVASAIAAVNYTMPAGSVAYGNMELDMETEVEYASISEIEQIPLTTAYGQTVHLSDVANIAYAVEDKTSYSRYNGADTVSITLQKKQSESSVTLSNEVKDIIESIEASNPDLHFNITYDAADEIVSTLQSVGKTLIEGILLSMVVIFIFFGDIKGSLIVGSTMPISLLVGIVCMYYAGISMNVISMNALVIAIGMITDNAVVVIELCFRKQQQGLSYVDAAYEGTKTVINSVIGSTVTTVIVYIPLATMNGLSGQIFKQLGWTIVFVLCASLLSAITIVPFFYTIYKPVEHTDTIVNRGMARITEWYGGVLTKVLHKKKLATFIAVGLFAIAMYLMTFIGTELMASTDEGIIQMSVSFRANLDLDTMDATMRELEDYVVASGLVDDYSTSVTQSSMSLMSSGGSSTITAYRADDVDTPTQEICDAWNQDLQDFSDICEITVSSGSTTGMSSMSSNGSEEIDITADDLDSLRAASDLILDTMRSTDGVLSATSTATESGTKINVVVDPEMARAKGFTAQQVSGLLYYNMNGYDACDVTIDGDTYSVTVEYPKDQYQSLSDVEAMTFTNTSGMSVPLTEMASVQFTSAPTTITRTDGRYSATITAVMTADTQDEVMEVLQPRLDALDLGEGVQYAENMITSMMNEEFSSIYQAIVVAVYLVFFVMAVQFESVVYSLLIMLCIPFAAIGSIVLMLIMGAKISMTSLLGILMLAGIVVNNGIIYIDTTNQFRAAGEDIMPALVHAGKDRLRPILITTLTTELSMLPVAFGLAKNSESMQGMSIVIVGGLFASTILTLLILPTFYMIVEKLRHPHGDGSDGRGRDRKERRRERRGRRGHRGGDRQEPAPELEPTAPTVPIPAPSMTPGDSAEDPDDIEFLDDED